MPAKITIQNDSTHDEPVTDPNGEILAVAKSEDKVTFNLETREDLERLTPYLVQLDARDDFEVTVKER